MPATLKLWLTPAQADAVDVPHGTFAYLKAYDLNARDGLGEAELTLDPDEAILWDTAADALDAWRAVSTVKPLRYDGRPNRPLTAYGCELEVRP